ncbi:MAG: glycosyltransferase, partial [Nitrospira sp.]|nr:glycosyltransferase [Nitrospira sp.]
MSEPASQMPDPSPGHSSPFIRHIAVLLILCGILFFWNLGALGLTDRDEGRNAEAGREMLETGDWMSPTFNYEPR